jgi:hypothetical protein
MGGGRLNLASLAETLVLSKGNISAEQAAFF